MIYVMYRDTIIVKIYTTKQTLLKRAGTGVIKSFYEGKRVNVPWWCGFDRRAWDTKSMADWLGPVAVAFVVMMM